jgi:DNA-binding LytR/AlgR family response regulator
MVGDLDSGIEILDIIDSVSGAVNWFRTFSQPDLVFMDIQLADGLSFEIFGKVNVDAPIIFTTAYDEYTLKAFKLNSVDYLLKPIDPEELETAWKKFKKQSKSNRIDPEQVAALLEGMQRKKYKERFLVKAGEQLNYLWVDDIAFFMSDEGVTQAISYNRKPHVLEHRLESLEEILDPEQFFRINRKLILNLRSIDKIHTWFNGRLKLDLKPNPDFEVFVSRDRVGDFKQWLDQ